MPRKSGKYLFVFSQHWRFYFICFGSLFGIILLLQDKVKSTRRISEKDQRTGIYFVQNPIL
jgi:hypothetical protein